MFLVLESICSRLTLRACSNFAQVYLSEDVFFSFMRTTWPVLTDAGKRAGYRLKKGLRALPYWKTQTGS